MKRLISSRAVVVCLLILLQTNLTAFGGITLTPGQGLSFTNTDALILTAADGMILSGPDALILTAADALTVTAADALILTAADALTYTGADAPIPVGTALQGIQSIDPELALLLDQLPNTSAINVFVAFHRLPSEADLNDLRAIGVPGGTRFRNLPLVIINATKNQIASISALPAVRSIYSNKTCEFLTHDTRVITGQSRIAVDSALTARNNGVPLSGTGVTVAVLDTGIDATHPDLQFGDRVIENARVTDLQGSAPDFLYPAVSEGLLNSDPVMGHGTFAAAIIAGAGAASAGYYGGMAPGAKLLGVSAGDGSLFHVLAGMDYIMSHRIDKNVRVVNCSFGISGLFDANDPVNIATKIMHDAGISVVFSAGNRGDQPNSLNPYSIADWVIGVGSGTKQGSLSDFSSRGAAGYGHYHPALVAPGEQVASARAAGINLVASAGLAGSLVSSEADSANTPSTYLPSYTTSSGTSFAAPHVAGTIALMLDANPDLAPDQSKEILQQTATPMLGYSRYEVGAGYLNSYAAVQVAALARPFGRFRQSIGRGITCRRESLTRFEGQVSQGTSYSADFQAPDDAIFATIEVGWLNRSSVATPLSVTVSGNDQEFSSKPASLLAGAGLQRTGITLNEPASGLWTITVSTSGAPPGTPQAFIGAIEIFRASYGELTDISQRSPAERRSIKCALRTGALAAFPDGFAPELPASRLDVARAVMLSAGAGVPQYLPPSPSFTDVPLDDSAIFVESVMNSPSGALMEAQGLSFNPGGPADRLTVAVAVVKSLGLESQAQAAALSNPGIADWDLIPATLRGYVAFAVMRNLMNKGVTANFRPFDSITRVELACAASALRQVAAIKTGT